MTTTETSISFTVEIDAISAAIILLADIKSAKKKIKKII